MKSPALVTEENESITMEFKIEEKKMLKIWLPAFTFFFFFFFHSTS